MPEIIIKTQKELDKLSLDHSGYIYIEGGTPENPLTLKIEYQKAIVIVRGNAYIDYVCDSAKIDYVCDSAKIGSVYGSAKIDYVYDSAKIDYVYDSAKIGSVYDSAKIGSVYGSAKIGSVCGSAKIGSVYGSAKIELWGEAVVGANAGSIICHGYNTIIIHKSDRGKINLVMNKDSHLVILPDYPKEFTFSEWVMRFPVEVKGKNAILYKAVHKINDKYYSDNNIDFEYKVGETLEHECAPKSSGSCATGLHIATKGWAVKFGIGWKDYALLECEVPIDCLVIADNSDGKVRTSKLKVLREVIEE